MPSPDNTHLLKQMRGNGETGGTPSKSRRARPDRLRKRSDFTEVMRKGRRARHALLQLVALRTDGDVARVGYAVGKQVGGAVVRNLVKRRLRSIVRNQQWAPGFDVVIVARPGADAATYGELQSIVCQSARKLRLLDSVA